MLVVRAAAGAVVLGGDATSDVWVGDDTTPPPAAEVVSPLRCDPVTTSACAGAGARAVEHARPGRGGGQGTSIPTMASSPGSGPTTPPRRRWSSAGAWPPPLRRSARDEGTARPAGAPTWAGTRRAPPRRARPATRRPRPGRPAAGRWEPAGWDASSAVADGSSARPRAPSNSARIKNVASGSGRLTSRTSPRRRPCRTRSSSAGRPALPHREEPIDGPKLAARPIGPLTWDTPDRGRRTGLLGHGQEEQGGVVGEVDQRLGPEAEDHGHPRAQRDGTSSSTGTGTASGRSSSPSGSSSASRICSLRVATVLAATSGPAQLGVAVEGRSGASARPSGAARPIRLGLAQPAAGVHEDGDPQVEVGGHDGRHHGDHAQGHVARHDHCEDHLHLGPHPVVKGAPAWASSSTAKASASTGWRPARPR